MYFRIMMNSQDIEAVKTLLASPKKISIVPHRNQDGDSMGSTLGLYHFLLQFNHSVTVVSPNEFPDYLAWMPNSDKAKIYETNTADCQQILTESDFIFTLDFNALHRTGDIMGSFWKR